MAGDMRVAFQSRPDGYLHMPTHTAMSARAFAGPRLLGHKVRLACPGMQVGPLWCGGMANIELTCRVGHLSRMLVVLRCAHQLSSAQHWLLYILAMIRQTRCAWDLV